MAVSGYEKKIGLCGNLKSHKMGSKNSGSGKFERIYGLICVFILLKRDSRGKPHVCVCVCAARSKPRCPTTIDPAATEDHKGRAASPSVDPIPGHRQVIRARSTHRNRFSAKLKTTMHSRVALYKPAHTHTHRAMWSHHYHRKADTPT